MFKLPLLRYMKKSVSQDCVLQPLAGSKTIMKKKNKKQKRNVKFNNIYCTNIFYIWKGFLRIDLFP